MKAERGKSLNDLVSPMAERHLWNWFNSSATLCNLFWSALLAENTAETLISFLANFEMVREKKKKGTLLLMKLVAQSHFNEQVTGSH